jgi:hypothetical protein
MARPLPGDTFGAGDRHLMGSASSCVTEVRLSSAMPAAALERLHLYLPSSHYSYGAVYTSISTPELSPPPSPELSSADETLRSELSFSNTLLLLKAEFPWRLGSAQEHAVSPPWIWTSENLCGPPPYQTRDLERVLIQGWSSLIPQCEYNILFLMPTKAKLLTHLADSAAFIITISFCDLIPLGTEHTAAQFLQTTPIRRLPGWLAEEWYYVRRHRSGRTSSSRHYVCMLSFGSTTRFGKTEEMVKECFRTMTHHTPSLQWIVEAYKLEGSLMCNKVEVPESARFCGNASTCNAKSYTFKLAKPKSTTPKLITRSQSLLFGHTRSKASHAPTRRHPSLSIPGNLLLHQPLRGSPLRQESCSG